MIKIIQTKHNQWYDIKDGVLEVEHKTFDHSMRYQEEHDDFVSFVKKDTLNFVVKDGKQIIGYLMSCPIEHDERYDYDKYFGKNNTLHLESMAILKKYRGEGLGNKLFVKFLETAKKAKYTRVVLDATSESMTNMALKHGFKKLKFYKKWDGDNSAWYMEKKY